LISSPVFYVNCTTVAFRETFFQSWIDIIDMVVVVATFSIDLLVSDGKYQRYRWNPDDT